jgi:HSP20 family protein
MNTNTQLKLVSRWPPFSWAPWRGSETGMRLVRERFAAGSRPAFAESYPPLNIWADSDSVYAEAELPGMQLDDLEIYVTEGNRLTIQGVRRQRALDNGVWHGQERGFGQFSRTIMLPLSVDADKVEARFEHGVLFVTLPQNEAAKPRRITVNAMANGPTVDSPMLNGPMFNGPMLNGPTVSSPAIKQEQRTELDKPWGTRGVSYTPRVDLMETEEESLLFADLPGVKPEDVDARFENGELIIDARCPPRHQGAYYLLFEYGVGDFYRAFSISQHIDWHKIAAELKNGVLTVHLPKAETVKPKKITVKGG